MKSSALLLTLAISFSGLCAGPGWYDWQETRKKMSLSAEESAMPLLILKHHVQYDYDLENGSFVMYVTIHRIVYVNNNEGVQKFNRIVMGMRVGDELVELKARTIGKNGAVTLFDRSNIKELKNEESGSANRIFAIEGAEVGGEIEYFYTRRTSGSVYRRELFQNDQRMKDVTFQLSCPKHLLFDFKSYNGLPVVNKLPDTARHRYQMETVSIPALTDEPFGYTDPSRMRLEFKLAYNTAKSQTRLYTFDDAAREFMRRLTTRSSEDQRAMERFMKSLSNESKLQGEARIAAIEKTLKTTIRVNPTDESEPLGQLSEITRNKVASETGMTRLFLAVFDALKIPYHIVMTCDRQKVKFDGKFDSWSYLEDYVLYFPEHKNFLAPYSFETRYPLLPVKFIAQKGLFIEPIELGGQRSALGSVRDIPAKGHQFDRDDLDLQVSFTGDDSNFIRQKRTFSGYGALDFTSYFDFLNDEKKHAIIDELMKQTAPDLVIKKWDARSVPFDSTARFVVTTDFTTSHFIERAGNRLLFKAGLLIGPQSELYRDDERHLDVENQSNRSYRRVINVELPEGYRVRNPEILNMHAVYDTSPTTPFIFKSECKVNGNTLTIVIWEAYNEISCPKSRYEDFRKVINAAADFNKAVLVLEKT